VEAVRAELTKADPDGRAKFARNARRVTQTLQMIDRRVRACVGRVAPAKRKIVTTHDALGYFARRYGVKVVGAVIPSLSTQAQASAGDVQRLVEQIRREGVEAVFPESSVNPDIEKAIAREAGASIGDPLYADSLGPRGSAGETYAGALAADAEALVRGMSGGRVDCKVRP
jgi:ABC-type Zn uptake system ZnuABC Zn-binding protein ZnuA